MNAHADKIQEDKNKSIANSASQKQGVSGSEGVAHKEMQEAINNSPRVQQLRAYRQMADNSPHAKQLRAYQAMADNYTAGNFSHEAWHTVRQRQGRVEPTLQMKGNIKINDDEDKAADAMGQETMDKVVVNQPFKSDPPVQMIQVLQRVVFNSNIEFENDGSFKALGQTNPENKAGSLNAMKNANAIVDPDLTANYQNGHMVAAMFGGNNKGDNIRVWSDNYEDTHTDLEKQVRYGQAGVVAAPQPNEKGTVSVTTTDQNNLFDILVNGLYAQVQNELNSVQYWDQQNVPNDPKKAMVAGLKGANIHKAVGAIPTSVRFKYDETTGGGRTVDVTTNAGLGQPAAGANSQDILNALGQYINRLVPAGDALPTAALVKMFGD